MLSFNYTNNYLLREFHLQIDITTTTENMMSVLVKFKSKGQVKIYRAIKHIDFRFHTYIGNRLNL